MNIYQLILRRRSIRRFQPKAIPFDTLKMLVNAGRLAPSAANLQPLEYIIVDDPGLRERVFSTLKWAGYIAPAGNPPPGEEPAALGEGIGSCWIESIDRPSLAGILGLPDKLNINSVIALGYPNEQPLTEELTQPDGSIKYWKDEGGRLHVPKRRLDDILYRNGYVTPEAKLR